jgi:anti-sigma-K factor RskA
MADSGEISLMTLVDRLAKLEGLLIGLQNSIVQGQSQTSASMARVERLEQRLVELETRQVTKDDLAQLTTKVDRLIAADATRRGGTAAATWTAGQLVAWVAVAVSLVALIGVGINREQLQQQEPTHQERQS